MTTHRVSFAQIQALTTTLGEIIVDQGVDIDIDMVREIHQALTEIFPQSFSLLINKKNAYSTQLDALILFGQLETINKIAVFAPNSLAKLSADFAATIPSSAELDIEVFTDKSDALAWLKQN